MEVNEFGFAWKDSWYLTPCYERSGTDCRVNKNVTCDASGNVEAAQMHPSYTEHEREGRVFIESFKIGGETGKYYEVSMSVAGIVDAKSYEGGIRDDGPADPDYLAANNSSDGTDTFHRSGSPTTSTYNIYKMTIFNPDGSYHSHYHLNSLPKAAESGRTFVIRYDKTIAVPGGGHVEYLNADRNCKAVNNCGAGAHQATDCADARRLPGDEASTPIPSSYGGLDIAQISHTPSQPYQSQLIHVTLTDVNEATP